MADPNLFDVLKMEQDDAELLLSEYQTLTAESEQANEDAERFNLAAGTKLQEHKNWLQAMGIDLESETAEAHKSATEDAAALIDEIEQANTVASTRSMSYEDLVAVAHSRGYTNTTVQNLLTEEEIQEVNHHLADIEAEFAAQTKLDKKDIAFLITAIALQVVRQYFITPFSERGTSKEGERIMKEKYGTKGKMSGKYYYATEAAIIGQKKVPFDIIAGSKNYDLGGKGKGLDGNSHRFRSLGHDPILGYIFGTANIITNTATWWNSSSHHILYRPNAKNISIPQIAAKADTGKVFDAVVSRFQGKDGKRILVEAITKEHLHLKSDKTTAGLPLPFLQLLSPDLAQDLAEYGLDAIALGEISKQAAGAELINFIIATIHGLLCTEQGELDCQLYRVRTKKIILLSNVIASTSNLIAVGIAAGIGAAGENPEAVKASLRYLDIGGILVTIAHLFTDLRFIAKVKEEFINSHIEGELLDELNRLDASLLR